MTQPASRQRQRPRPERLDIAIAAAYAVVFLVASVLAAGPKVVFLPLLGGAGPASITIDLGFALHSYASIGLMLASGVAMAWRRARPEASFLAILGIAATGLALGEPVSLWWVALPIGLFSAAAYAERGFARLALAISVIGYVGFWALAGNLFGRLGSLRDITLALSSAKVPFVILGFALLFVVWVLGDQVRAARERAELRLERLAQAERERQADARIGAMAERHRIARELHDVVAHGLAVMIVQADGALYAEAAHPEAPRQALATIAATGRESLAEMRHLLGVLRDDPDADRLAPQPGLDSVPALIERFREAGLTVDHRVDGLPRAVPQAAGLTAYRVVQESLTNVLHHVGPTRVESRITFLPYGLGIVVVNEPGSRPPAPPDPERTGLGLVGMQERVGLLGGRMTAGPTAAGGFEVRVEIPDGTRREGGPR